MGFRFIDYEIGGLLQFFCWPAFGEKLDRKCQRSVTRLSINEVKALTPISINESIELCGFQPKNHPQSNAHNL